MRQPRSWWTRLTFWRRPPSTPPLGHLHFVMYTRCGCHLCDDAWEILKQAQQRYGVRLEAIDVDADPELTTRYGEQVPVVTVNGKLRFRGAINRALLERLFQAERSRLETPKRRPQNPSE
jgi:glutaredoxin